MKLGRLQFIDLSPSLRWLSKAIALIGSLQLAVVLIGVYAVLLAWATVVESNHGMAAAHFAIYDTGWFAAMGGLVAVNVLCAALVRLPWKRRQTGFVITHAGILVLLVGCLLSRQVGIEAQLPIFEGRTSGRAFLDSSHFRLEAAPSQPRDAPAGETICVPFVAGPFSWDEYAKLWWFPWRLPYRSQGAIYDEDGIRLEVLDYTVEPLPTARVRLSVDEASKEFDVAALSAQPPDQQRRHVLAAKRRRVTISLPPDEIDLGFQLRLHKFQRKLDPGAGTASHYSSLVDVLDLGQPPRKLCENVLITLNAPIDVADPQSGRTYRLFQSSFSGPWMPGEPEFDRLVDGDRSRDQLYLSRLSVNYDPGRGLKYLGSLLIVAGIVVVYYLRALSHASI